MDGERPIDIHQYTRALRRAAPAIVGLAALAAAVTVVISLFMPKTYVASATILALDGTGSGATDVTVVQRRLETVKRLAGTTFVMQAAAARLPGVTADDLRAAVSASVDATANVLSVEAKAPTAVGAAARANVAAQTLVAAERRLDGQIAAEARGRAIAEIKRLRAAGAEPAEIEAAQARLAAVTADAVVSTTALRILEKAEPPSGASSPRPLLGGVVAFLVIGLLGLLVVLAREQIAPRLSSTRDIDELLGVPVLENVPVAGRREASRFSSWPPGVRDAYYGIAAAVQRDAKSGETRIVLVTSATRREGRTSVSAGLARALAGLGSKTLVISGDLRRPTLHELLKVPRAPGLSDVVIDAQDDDKVRDVGGTRSKRFGAADGLRKAIHGTTGGSGKVDVLPSGSPTDDPAEVLFSDGMGRVFREISARGYDFVVVDSPPAVGLPDVQALAKHCDAVLVVARVDRLTAKDAFALRDRLAKLDIRKLGAVVVGDVTYPLSYGSHPGGGPERRPRDRGVIELG